jgi:uncharacterized protein YjbI with pentapeptide repeats
MAGCGAAAQQPVTSAEEVPLEAVQCQLTSTQMGQRYGKSGRMTQKVTLIAGDTRTLDAGAATLQATLFDSALRVVVQASGNELLNALYPFEDALPPNLYDSHGFTGEVNIGLPDGHGYHQLTCRSVPRSEYTDSPADHTAQREARAEARRAELYATLTATENCSLTPRQQEAGESCPPRHPLQARVQALLELRRLGERQFTDVVLKGAALEGADLRETYFQQVRFDHANLKRAQLYACDFRFSRDLEGVNLEGANVYSTELIGANLKGANLQRASLEQANLEKADLTGANLQGANLMYADLDGANLTGAALSGAMMKGASLSGTILDDADLAGARNLTQQQLDVAHGNGQTRLPADLVIRRQP